MAEGGLWGRGRRGEFDWSIWFVSFVWLGRTENQRNQMNKSDEWDWCGARLVGLVDLVEEKQRDLESAFCGLACWLSPMSRG